MKLSVRLSTYQYGAYTEVALAKSTERVRSPKQEAIGKSTKTDGVSDEIVKPKKSRRRDGRKFITETSPASTKHSLATSETKVSRLTRPLFTSCCPSGSRR